MPSTVLALPVVLALTGPLVNPVYRVADQEAVIASSDEIVGENCYVAREPTLDEAGRTHIQVEVMCD